MTTANGTQPTPDVPIVDPGNPMLTEGPAMLSLGQVPTPTGPRVVLTIRTPTTTLTCLLQRQDALNWARLIRQEAQGLSTLLLPPGAAL